MTAYSLNGLGADAFEHLVVELAQHVIGLGVTGFGPGPDGGRDAYFRGRAPYPSDTEAWGGIWHIQAKFHAPNLSSDHHKWLYKQVKAEVKAYKDPNNARRPPNNWIVATNINASGTPNAGSFDRCVQLVAAELPTVNFDIWQGNKILGLLTRHGNTANRYRHLLTPGHAISAFIDRLNDDRAEAADILRHLIIDRLVESKHLRLEEAGSTEERPGVHDMFVELPMSARGWDDRLGALREACRAAARPQQAEVNTHLGSVAETESNQAGEARCWILMGGPGQGKSTLGQVLAQLHRARLILDLTRAGSAPEAPQLTNAAIVLAQAITRRADLPKVTGARIPITVELRSYADHVGRQKQAGQPHGLWTYLAEVLSNATEKDVSAGLLKRLLLKHDYRWLIVFDGLDEVPSAVKGLVATGVRRFLDDTRHASDIFALCTTRPQGYNREFEDIEDAAYCELVPLEATEASNVAERLIRSRVSAPELPAKLAVLEHSLKSHSVRGLMKTPLQAHIIAILIVSGSRPPERRLELYREFFRVIRQREANRHLPDPDLRNLFQSERELIYELHYRTGFTLHARAETASGATASLARQEFVALAQDCVRMLKGDHASRLANTAVAAAEERLVLISTPSSKDQLSFDIRQLQEFFAAEHLGYRVDADQIAEFLRFIIPDSHWREVTHFLISGLVFSPRSRKDVLLAADAIQSVDAGYASEASKPLTWRLRRGTLILCQLIADGILEDDRQLRCRFEGALRPLVDGADFYCITYLRQATRDTRAWVIEVLAREVEARAPDACIGALVALWSIVKDQDKECARVTALFRDQPDRIRVVMRELREEGFWSERRRLTDQPWKLGLSLQEDLTPYEAWTLVDNARAHRGSIPIDDFGLPEEVSAEAFAELLDAMDALDFDMRKTTIIAVVKLTDLSISVRRFAPTAIAVSDSARTHWPMLPGGWSGLGRAVLAVAESSTKRPPVQLPSGVGAKDLPYPLARFFLAPDDDELANEICLESPYWGPERDHELTEELVPALRRLGQRSPRSALRLWEMVEGHYMAGDAFPAEGIGRAVATLVDADHNLLREIPLNLWGRFYGQLSSAPDREVLKACGTDTQRWGLRILSWIPFQITRHTAQLLPAVLEALIITRSGISARAWEPGFDEYFAVFQEGGDAAILEGLRRIIAEYVGSPYELVERFGDSENHDLLAAWEIALSSLYSGRVDNLVSIESRGVLTRAAQLRPATGPALSALGLLLAPLAAVESLIADFLRAIPLASSLRGTAWPKLLLSIRERSQAPVTTHGMIDNWVCVREQGLD